MMRTEFYLRSNLIAADGSQVYLPLAIAFPCFVFGFVALNQFFDRVQGHHKFTPTTHTTPHAHMRPIHTLERD